MSPRPPRYRVITLLIPSPPQKPIELRLAANSAEHELLLLLFLPHIVTSFRRNGREHRHREARFRNTIPEDVTFSASSEA